MLEVTSQKMKPVRSGATVSEPPLDTKLIGGRLLTILRERGISLADLAAKADVSASALSLLTRGLIRYPRIDTLRNITDALAISPGELPGSPDWLAGERPFEGVRLVPVVRLPLTKNRSYVHQRGGELVAIPESAVGGRERVLSAVIDVPGMSPYVLVGDRVIFDPDVVPELGTMVLIFR